MRRAGTALLFGLVFLLSSAQTITVRRAGGAPPFSPSDISGLVVWLEGDDAADKTEDVNGISQWAGNSPTTVDFDQATDANKPNTTSSFQNSLDCVDFIFANNESMATAASIGIDLATEDMALWMVYSVDRVDADFAFTAEEDGTGTGRTWAQFEATGDKWRTVIGGGGDSTGSRSATTTYLDAIIWDQSAGTVDFRSNGAADGQLTSLTGEAASGIQTLGDNKSGGQNLDGVICELIIYDTVPSGGEITSLESYLNTRWAVY